MKKLLIRITFVVVTFSMGFLILELIIRKIYPQVTYSQALNTSSKCYYSDKQIPFSLMKNARCKMSNYKGDFKNEATINSQGYRGEKFSFLKNKDTTRILILGDSITFGIGVTDQETYPAQLEAILQEKIKPQVEVINAGYASGFAPDTEYVYLKNRGLALKPDIILLGFFVWNDISDLSETIWEKIDDKGLPEKITSCCRVADEGILRNKSIEFKYRYPWLRESHLYIFMLDILNNKFHIFNLPPNEVAKRDLNQGCILNTHCIDIFKNEEEKTYKVISAMNKICEDNGIKFIIAIFPVDYQIYPAEYKKYGTLTLPEENNRNFIQKRIEQIFSEQNIDYLDLYQTYVDNKARGNPFFAHDAHLNKLGNRIAAEEIAKYIIEKKLIK
jgi:lysophospholipase L1-like esterase